MKAIVTGAAGFIGAHIATALLEGGHEIIGIDALRGDDTAGLRARRIAALERESGFRLVAADLADLDIAALLPGVEFVSHHAGRPGVRASWGDDFAQYVHDNVVATQHLLEACRDAPALRRMVLASSSSVYGEPRVLPTDEQQLPAPVSPYGVTKLAAERLGVAYASSFGIPVIGLRYFSVYGPGQRPDMAISRLIAAADVGTPFTVFGDGEQVRDFTYVEDVVDANLRSIDASVLPGSVFNVAGGTGLSMNAVIDLVERATGREIDVRRTDPARGDVHRTEGDITRIGEALDWTPSTPIADGIAAQLAATRGAE
jgi:UDP-glucuronate 4-epimerase